MTSNEVILHVENDANDVFLIHRALRETGVTNPVRVAENGEQAVDYLQGRAPFDDRLKHPLPSLILLDLSMPLMTGLELLEWLRHQPLLRRIPVVVLTSSRHDQDIKTAYEHGASSYLVKPLCYHELVDIIKAFRQFWLLHNELPSAGNELV